MMRVFDDRGRAVVRRCAMHQSRVRAILHAPQKCDRLATLRRDVEDHFVAVARAECFNRDTLRVSLS